MAALSSKRRPAAGAVSPDNNVSAHSSASRRHQEHRRSRLGQGRGRQVDGRRQSGAGLGGAGRQSGYARRGHLRSQPASHARPQRPAPGHARRQVLRAADVLRSGGHVDRVSHRRGAADGVARADGHAGIAATPQRHPLECAGLPGGGHAARYGRHTADLVAARSGERRDHRHHASGHRVARCAQGIADVREGRPCRCSASSRT